MPESDNPTSPYDQPVVSEDFLTGDVALGLERMRLRLLDLTARNRLLNFRYTKKSSLRVVDELPDQLFSKLVDGKELYFKGVPLPRGAARTASAPEGQIELAVPGVGQPAGQPARSQLPPAKDHAAILGIETSFDLPANGAGAEGEVPRRHADSYVQCLHYPADLEAILRSISSSARLAVEETGTNMLYLVFGFLDWYESLESDQLRTAPLILVPVTLHREAADEDTRTYRYAVRYSGEDILANVCLQEKLRRDFNLELPSLDDFELPDSYFERLRPLLSADERWRLRRHVTLTLLSFGKLLMYRDLDSRTWPAGKGPADHDRIKEFFRGIQRERVTFAADYRLDEPPVRDRVPPIVDEADSSQHSALVDALSGKNLVIEGPPGTGKSQTITNLIAAALASGKSVLFVSEKLAALEVVRHRLDRVGLGSFCLELHSHKSQKRQLLDDIHARIKQWRTFRPADSLEQRLRVLDEDKRRLTEYAELINRPFGQLQGTLHDVMWSARRRRRALRFDAALVENVRLPHPEQLDAASLANLHQCVEQYATHVKAVTAGEARVIDHPWYGFRNRELTFIDQPVVVGRLRAARDIVRDVQARVAELNTLVGVDCIPGQFAAIEKARIAIDGLPREAGDIIPRLLPRLRDARLRQRLEEFRVWVGRYLEIAAAVREKLGAVPSVGAQEIREIEQQYAIGLQRAPGAKLVGDIGLAASSFTAAAEAINRAGAALKDVSRWLSSQFAFTSAGCHLGRLALDRIQAAPFTELHYRHAGLEGEAAAAALEAAEAEATRIRAQREELSRRFDVSFLPPASELRRHLTVATDARWWSFVSSEFRAARRTYRSLVKGSPKVQRREMAPGFRRLLEFALTRDRFENNRAHQGVAGTHFDGIDTRFDLLQRVQGWLAESRRTFAHAGEEGAGLCRAVWATPSDRLVATREADGEARRLTKPLVDVRDALEAAAAWRARSLEPETDDEDLATLGPELEASGRDLASAHAALEKFALPGNLQLEDVPEVLRYLTELDSLRTLIGSAREVMDALGEHFRGPDTDLARVARTEILCERISNSNIPAPLKHWLLREAAPERIRRIHDEATWLGEKLGAWREAWRVFAETGRLTGSEWFARECRVDELPLRDIIARSERALGAEEYFPAWLDYLDAREAIERDNLTSLIPLAEQGHLPANDLADAFRFILANSLVHEAFRQHPELARFSGLTHNAVRERFAKIDREAIELHREHAAWQIDQRRVPIGIGSGPVGTWTELELLENEISKQRRHIPLRQLMLRAGRALQALKPCFMMGPLSVAQYLPPGGIQFDLVVMDEASQLKPEDALGAIARASQVVVVGDRMQLPPTSFFDRIGEEGDEEEDGEPAQPVSEAESILDVASTVYKPVRLLRWHYRSRHGSLIAFSNKEFYKGELVAFPSPTAKSPEFGIKFIHVRDGAYENSRNLTEAKRVVETALRLMERRPHESLGIVTLNTPQRELVEALIDERLKSHPAGQRYVETRVAGLEPFFVKNLENVQGDERDVIYISVTYGRSPNGHVFQRFGPINGPTGHRRLNVLFTRARRRVVTFASMTADDIRVQPSSAWGVRALKGYLQYAQTGVLERALLSGREPDSDFETEVADALRQRGYEVVAQVGVAGYYIDLAVKHPRKPDAFMLGIECDGATYHSGRSARDRDRLRQSVLEDLGWKIHRIWSTDWFKHPGGEIDRIVRRIESLEAEANAQPVGGDSLDYAELTDVDAILRVSAEPAANEPDGWDGEAAEQPLSIDEAREALIALRDEIAAARNGHSGPDVLLRDEMLQILLRSKPATTDDWKRHTPLQLRLDTNGDEVQQYLERVLAVTSRMAK